eukprot:scaffold681470_cov94-Prasinocladus_malaysianus.AAC.1
MIQFGHPAANNVPIKSSASQPIDQLLIEQSTNQPINHSIDNNSASGHHHSSAALTNNDPPFCEGPKDHRDHWGQLRRRQLWDVWPSLQPEVPLHVAKRPDQRHGRRAGSR